MEEVNLENKINSNDANVYITQFTSGPSRLVKGEIYNRSNWHFGNSMINMSLSSDGITERLIFVAKGRFIDVSLNDFSKEASNRFVGSLIINGEKATTTPLADNMVWDWPEAKKK